MLKTRLSQDMGESKANPKMLSETGTLAYLAGKRTGVVG